MEIGQNNELKTHIIPILKAQPKQNSHLRDPFLQTNTIVSSIKLKNQESSMVEWTFKDDSILDF